MGNKVKNDDRKYSGFYLFNRELYNVRLSQFLMRSAEKSVLFLIFIVYYAFYSRRRRRLKYLSMATKIMRTVLLQ